uniref:Uncharacterized protein n=2 Tax=Poecilia TaxID=8080 RepID=A0A3B3U8Q5_9TELE
MAWRCVRADWKRKFFRDRRLRSLSNRVSIRGMLAHSRGNPACHMTIRATIVMMVVRKVMLALRAVV